MYKNYTIKIGMPPGYLRKLLMVMKFTTFIILAALVQVSAATFGQKLTLVEKSVSIEKVLLEIRKQTGYDVLIIDSKFDVKKKIQANFRSAPLSQVMDKVVAGTQLTYKIDEQNVVLQPKEEPSFIDKIIARFQEIEVRGKVLDENGKGLPGVTIKVKNGKSGTFSAADGTFYLKNVDENATIILTYIGYNLKEEQAKSEMGDVSLQLSDNKLDQVQVIAYGQTTQRLSVGNVSTITEKQIENKPVQNVLLALQGEVPGIAIRRVNGRANSGLSIQLQGMNSFFKSNQPFYVVDGIPQESEFNNQYSDNTRGGFNPLNYLNPQDIASVSILKGADATSIFGSRAANGAILITTKKRKRRRRSCGFQCPRGIFQLPKVLKNDEQRSVSRDA